MESLSIFATAIVMVCLPAVALAAVWHVPADVPTIQAGIDSASAGDTVLVACGTYYEHDIAMKSGVVLGSETGEPECVTIDANGLGQVLYCIDADSTTRIEGFTITGGYATGSGTGLYGGGIHCADSSPAFTRCTVSGNSSAYSAGGIYIESGAPTLTHCTVSDNSAPYSGGIHVEGSSPSLHTCTVSNNSANLYGGGMWCCDSSFPILTHCTFFGNSASGGGGMYISSGSSPTLTRCTLSHNSTYGGHGGGVYVFAASATLENTIVAFSPQGEGVYCYAGSGATLTCCDVYGNPGGDWVGCLAGQNGVDGNFPADPMFCDSSVGNFRLDAESPCAPANSPPGCGLIGANGTECGTVAGAETETEAPGEFYLGLAVPNPFNPVTEISYGIPAGSTPSHVTMSIYDATGREVTTLVDADRGPGEYRVVWEGRDHKGSEASSGVYFYRICWNGRSQTKRMVLLK